MVAAWEDEEEVAATLRATLRDVLGLAPERVAGFDEWTPLSELALPAAGDLIRELRERLGIRIEDEEVDARVLATFGSLLNFLRAKALR